MSIVANQTGQIVLINVNYAFAPLPPGEDIDIYYRGINDVPTKNTFAGTFQADMNGFFHPPVVITNLIPNTYYIIHVESCGCSYEQVMYAVAISLPPAAPVITGPTPLCPLAAATYSITAVASATSYLWTIPVGWTLVKDNGTSIDVKTGAGGSTADVKCKAVNSGGVSADASLTVTVNNGPGPVGTITGPTLQRPNLSGQVYSVTPVSDVPSNGYTWTVPAGWKIDAGQTTQSITVTTGISGGFVAVTATNPCGSTGGGVNINVLPATPVITGDNKPCTGAATIYSVTPVPTATSYIWHLPQGWTFKAGTPTNTSSVTVIPSAISGDVTVSAVSAVGTGVAGKLSVVVQDCTPSATGNYSVTYTNNKAIHVAVHYGNSNSGLSGTMVDTTYPLHTITGTIPIFTNANVQLNVSAFAPGETHLVSAALTADGVLVGLTNLTDTTAEWNGVTGSNIVISFVTQGDPEPPAGEPGFAITQTNNQEVNVVVHYGSSSPSNTLVSALSTGEAITGDLPAAFTTAPQMVQMNLSGYSGGTSHLVTASLTAEGGIHNPVPTAPELGTNSAIWRNVQGEKITISFLTG